MTERAARRWLRLDAAYCAGAGLAALVLAAPLGRLFHAPATVLMVLGLLTLLWAAALAVMSRAVTPRRPLALVAAANVAASAAVAVLALVAPALAARLLLAAVAVEVAAIAAVQRRVLERPAA